MTLAKEFFSIFEGFRGHHGTYGDTTVSPEGKVEIRKTAKTIKQPVSENLWQMHLNGERPLGIVPVNEEGMCYWGCVDIDKVNHENVVNIAKTIYKKCPFFVICKSKSGNLHAYVFFKEPVPAKDVRTLLANIAATIGYADREIFPKQDAVLYEKGDIGSWLNMPYLNESATQHYAISETGEQLSARQFIDTARSRKVLYNDLLSFQDGQPDIDAILRDLPPCFANMLENGIGSGSRNTAMFHLATGLKKALPQSWTSALEDYNRKICVPPLSSEELTEIIKSHRKKDYNYKCKEEPMAGFCNAKLCRTRKFGIKGSEDFAFPKLSAMAVFLSSPPIYFLDVNGIRVEFSVAEITDQRAFRRKCFEKAGIYPPGIKDVDWCTLITNLRDSAVIIEAPEEASPEAEFLEIFEDFIFNSPSADSKEDILRGCVYLNTENKIYSDNCPAYQFKLSDLMDFLKKKDFKTIVGRNKITLFLRTHKGLMGESKNEKEIRPGQSAKTWVVRSDYFQKSSAGFSVPNFKKQTVI